jgi:hypothetical protein
MSASPSVKASPQSRPSSSQESRSKKSGMSRRLLHWFEKKLGRSIRLQGKGLGTRLVLKKLPVVPAQPQFPGMVLLKPVAIERQKLMRKELHELLRKHPKTTSMLRHLTYVERTLRLKGVPGIDALPLNVLTKALAQLESLVRNWSVSGLDEVRSRLTLLIKNKEIIARNTGEADASNDLSDSGSADVCEVSHSIFEEMERSWHGQVPANCAAAMTSSANANAKSASHQLSA